MKAENTYVMNLEGAYIYKDKIEQVDITIKNRDLAKLFSATAPYSLDTMRVDKIFEGEENYYKVNNKQYTKKIINVTFDKSYYKLVNTKHKYEDGNFKKRKKVIANKKKIRNKLYAEGFTVDGIDYIFYKRGAGKAKNGYALYIQKEYRDKLILRSRLGVVFDEDEEVDLTSLLAYESLIMSGIDFTIDIDPKTEMVIIDDIYGKKFNSEASVTREIDGELVTDDEIIEIQNCLTDGQGLLDSSVFKKYEKEDKGFMLLRNDFFKCCAFNTNLKEWFEYNNIKEVIDMFGNKYDADKIKLITTPNSLKFLKFAYKVSDKTGLNQKSDCFDYYVDNIESTFGVVKTDKEGNYGNHNRTTYQLLNSIPNLTYDDLMEVSKQEREYVDLLKNDIAVFRHYLGCDVHASIELEENMDSNEMGMYETADLMNMLMMINSDFQYTKKFKDLRKNIIQYYIKHLKEGSMRLEGSKYMTLFSNPYEMLLASIGKYKQSESIYNNKSIFKNREVYSPQYVDGQDFCVSRNPHINAGNVMWAKNKKRDEYKWFNITDNIAIVNTYDNDLPDRLQGCDFDSDTAQFITHPVLVDKAFYCEKNFSTPINKVKGLSVPRRYNLQELASLDVVLSDNYIGKIINLSQIINSYMNHAIQNNEPKEKIKELFHLSSRLSSMSQIEIDKSKKVFDNVDMKKEISLISKNKHIRYETEEIVKKSPCGAEEIKEVNKMVCPNFISMISDSNRFRVLERFDTPLDILQDVLKWKKAKYTLKSKEFKQLLVKKKSIDGRVSDNSLKSVHEIIESCSKKINWTRHFNDYMTDENKRIIIRGAKEEAIVKLKKLKTNDKTIYKILEKIFKVDKNDRLEFSKHSMITLQLLNQTKQLQLMECFKSKDTSDDEVLIKNSSGNIDIFGVFYDKCTRKDLTKIK